MPAALHSATTRALALRVIGAGATHAAVAFPPEAGLCREYGVSRTVIRESIKVLTDKGMLEVRPRTGTRARPRSEWNLLDPDILNWRAELEPDAAFLRDLCEVRLAIEPTAAGFAALRATPEEIGHIASLLPSGDAGSVQPGFDLEIHAAVVAACRNPMLRQLSGAIRQPFLTALKFTARHPANLTLSLDAHNALVHALRHRDPMAARTAAGDIVGLAMIAAEETVRAESARHRMQI